MRVIDSILQKEGWYKEIFPFLMFVVWELMTWGIVVVQTAGKILTYKKSTVNGHTWYRSVLLDMRVHLLVVLLLFILIQAGMIYWSYKHQYNWGGILIPVYTLLNMGLLIQLASGEGFLKQFGMIVIGTVLMLLFTIISCVEPGRKGLVLILIMILFLGLVNLIFAKPINGSRAWIIIAGISIQPGEFFKVLDIILVSIAFERIKNNLSIRRFCIFTWFIEIVVLVIVHDLGNALILMMLGFCCALAFSIWETIIAAICWSVVGAAVLVGSAIVFDKVFSKLSYMADRFSIINTVLMNTDAEHNFRRMMLAVIRAGMQGTGMADGDYAYHMNIMAANSDYVTLSIASIFGISGIAIITVALMVLVRNSDSEQDALYSGQYLSGKLCGIVLILHAVINIAAATNIGPLTGTTFPLVSAGGSSIIANSMLIGILLGNRLPKEKRMQYARKLHLFTDSKVEFLTEKGTNLNNSVNGVAKKGTLAFAEAMSMKLEDDYEYEELSNEKEDED